MSGDDRDPFNPDSVRVPRPCEVSSAFLEGRPEGWLCRSCSTPVIDISSMSREDASKFLGATRDTPMCIAYDERSDGTIAFAPTGATVPLRRLLGGLGKVTLSAALAACTSNAPTPAPDAEPATVKPAEVDEPTPEQPEPEPQTTIDPSLEDDGNEPEPEPKPLPIEDDVKHVKGKRAPVDRPHKVGKRMDPEKG
jgi:hypothetical protein